MFQQLIYQLKKHKAKKQLNEGFKRPAYWNKYKMQIWSENPNRNPKRLMLNASFH